MTDAIISMASNLGLEVVAEGVEIPQQADYLEQHECQYAQGFLYSKPVDVVEVEKILKKNQLEVVY